jgi:FdhD protein
MQNLIARREEATLVAGSRWLEVCRYHDGHYGMAQDQVAEECPVALVFNGISHAVMMATPLELEYLAIGFALSEGIVARREEIYAVDVLPACEGFSVQLEIGQSAFMALKSRRRALAGRTGCGVCGIESLEMLDLMPERLPAHLPPLALAPQAIATASAGLRQAQQLMEHTGGVHAAAWCDLAGNIVCVYEDVGRHNALDKLLGFLADRRVDVRAGFVFMSSRASYELVRKAARLQLPLLATISAPTTLAVQMAELAGIRLLSFCRGNGFVRYGN